MMARNRPCILEIMQAVIPFFAKPNLNLKQKKAAKSRFQNKTLAMTYFHMGRPHTIIGARMFHF